MKAETSLKQRLRSGEPYRSAGLPVSASRSEIEAVLTGGQYDMITTDAQHAMFEEKELRAFCAHAAEFGVPVRFRIRHTRDAYLIGRYLDMGVLGIIMPQVDDEATVDQVIREFYYPPIGLRSWGPHSGHGYTDTADRVEYANWWNEHGVLCLQLESVDAIVNARKLAKSGVDMLAFGANDLDFSLETYTNPPFTSVQECVRDVVRQMEGTGVRVDEFGLRAEHLSALAPVQ